MNTEPVKVLNLFFTAAICVPLVGAYVIQFGYGEYPCPLCLLQRLAMLGIAVGAMMNLRFGVRPAHYALCMLGALFGAAVSTRQILLHIVPDGPNGPGYGSPVLGMHLYTWALLIFMTTIFLIALVMLSGGHFAAGPLEPVPMDTLSKIVLLVAVVVAGSNAVMTFLMCGIYPCPDNPNHYRMLEVLGP